jgi:putative FmdB family regulatory protein
MPLYDYRCDACGAFRAWRGMSAAAEPVACPSCDAPAGRVMAMPNLALMHSHTRIAHQRNEKSADEPRVERLSGHGHAHAGPHAHHHRHGHGVGGRPWMLGH